MFSHTPVLLNETINGLNVDKDKIYVDGTIGGGGHSEKILEVLENGSGFLIGIDQDEDAINEVNRRLKKYIDNKKLILVKNNFENIDEVLDNCKVDKVDGILLDLGVSSFQFDEGVRGFSYNKNAKLDMRMDKNLNLTCEELINTFSENDIYHIIKDYGEEKFAKNIAKHIIENRKTKKIETTFELADIIKNAIPAKIRFGENKNPAKRTFQALRIYINRELEVLDIALDKIINRLNDNGRICIITFHSLEDRIVKNKFKTFENPCTCPKGYPCVCGKKSFGKIISKKGIVATDEEVVSNKRSHSARLRVFERRVL